MVLEYNVMEVGLLLVLLLLMMFGVALFVGCKVVGWWLVGIVWFGFGLLLFGMFVLILIVLCVGFGWALFVLLVVVGSVLGLFVSQFNNYTLFFIFEECVSEVVGVNLVCGSFGFLFGFVFAGAIMFVTLSIVFINWVQVSIVLFVVEQ